MSGHTNPIYNKIKRNKVKIELLEQISEISKEN